MRSDAKGPPLIVHIVYRFATGGLENGLVNLVNSLPSTLARHKIIALVGVDHEFSSRISSENCTIESLDADPDQQTLRILPSIYSRLRALEPAVVHTRNIATLECQLAAWLARVPIRIHGEHGWDDADQYGSNWKYTRLRKVAKHLLHRQVALSGKTRRYLQDKVGIAPETIREIHNGVNTDRFVPRADRPNESGSPDWPFSSNDFVIGTVGRLSAIKNQILLCRAFCHLRRENGAFRSRARLVLIGDGSDRQLLEESIASEGATDAVWFAGERGDIPSLLQRMDLFCLPSKAEGLANSILEAMATGLPVVATDVGGNKEQVLDGETGTLVASEDQTGLCNALKTYFDRPQMGQAHGQAGRQRALENFSLEAMVATYQQLYSDLLASRGVRLKRESS